MKILLVDSNDARREALSEQLKLLGEEFVVLSLTPQASLLAEVERLRPDVALVDMARPDRDVLDSLSAKSCSAPVVVSLEDEDADFMKEVMHAGVSSYRGHNVTPDAAKIVMRLAVAFFQRNKSITLKLHELEDQACKLKAVEQAKRLLMKKERMGEEAAHRFLQRRAMDQQKRLVDVATDYLAAQIRQSQES